MIELVKKYEITLKFIFAFFFNWLSPSFFNWASPSFSDI